MFVALAIVCDEFFVPALGVLTEKVRESLYTINCLHYYLSINNILILF